jgi:hypothetical protein
MNLTEIYQPIPDGYRTEKDDNSVYRKDEPRKRRTKLTLEKLNRLRNMNDVRRLEHEKKLDSISDQYKSNTASGDATMGGGLGL